MDNKKIGDLFLILGAVLFVGRAVGYMTGQLPAYNLQVKLSFWLSCL